MLKRVSEDPSETPLRRDEARYRLALGAAGWIRNLQAIEAGTLPLGEVELEKFDGYQSFGFLGGLHPGDLTPIERAIRAEARALGVPEPYGSRDCEAWFRARFGTGSQDWFETEFQARLPDPEFGDWLRDAIRPLEKEGR